MSGISRLQPWYCCNSICYRSLLNRFKNLSINSQTSLFEYPTFLRFKMILKPLQFFTDKVEMQHLFILQFSLFFLFVGLLIWAAFLLYVWMTFFLSYTFSLWCFRLKEMLVKTSGLIWWFSDQNPPTNAGTLWKYLLQEDSTGPRATVYTPGPGVCAHDKALLARGLEISDSHAFTHLRWQRQFTGRLALF